MLYHNFQLQCSEMTIKHSKYLIYPRFSIGKKKLNVHSLHLKQVNFNTPKTLNGKDTEISSCILLIQIYEVLRTLYILDSLPTLNVNSNCLNLLISYTQLLLDRQAFPSSLMFF